MCSNRTCRRRCLVGWIVGCRRGRPPDLSLPGLSLLGLSLALSSRTARRVWKKGPHRYRADNELIPAERKIKRKREEKDHSCGQTLNVGAQLAAPCIRDR